MSDEKIVLHYIGNGEFIVGVPAADLTAADIAACRESKAELIASGLYAEAKPKEKVAND